MKNLFVITSILLSTTQIAMAEDFTVTAKGEVAVYSFYNKTKNQGGVGIESDITVDFYKAMDDGSSFGVKITAETPNSFTGYGYYKFELGELRAGSMDASSHGVDLPDAGDAIDMKFTSTAFSNSWKSEFGNITMPRISPAITYSTHTIMGFQSGIGFKRHNFDAKSVLGFDTEVAAIKVGVGYAARYDAVSSGVVSLGGKVKIVGIEAGAKISHDLAALTKKTSGEISGKFDVGSVEVGGKYTLADITVTDRGVLTTGVKFKVGSMQFGANYKTDNSTNIIATRTAQIGAKYSLGAFSLGSTGEYKFVEETYSVNSGLDYNLNKNIIVGGGVSYDHDKAVSGAAGIKFKF